ncbi:hypothetical protein HKCCE3408_16885 [Rhodobacterales bacterium HKCCE3408]|nr:hypothetical protein [Rhodobacterales bacterium HKCCE3408]
MQITLHVGAHRTASTTFQHMMAASRGRLTARGIGFWGPRRMRGEGQSGSDHRALERALDEAGAGHLRQLVISEENLLGSMRANLRSAVLYPDVAMRALRVAPALGARVGQVGIAIRSYPAYWASALAFSMTRGGPAPEPALCEALVAQSRRWRDVIEDIAMVWPEARIRVWTYEGMAARPEAVAEALLGAELPRLSGARDWHNAQPTPAILRRTLRHAGRSPGLIRERADRFMPFTDPERRWMQTAYAADLAWLRAGAGPRIDYIDDLGADPGATRGRGRDNDGADRKMA